MRISMLGPLVRSANATPSSGNWFSSVGLLWASGIEPAGNESTFYAVHSGFRAWYVDADAVSNGNGSSGSPYNSFTELNNLTAPGYQPGDHIYVKGTFSFTKHNALTKHMRLQFPNTSYAGSTTNPTVIRSWPGQARAIFDAEYQDQFIPLDFRWTGTDGTGGVVVINVEVKRGRPAGIAFGREGDNILGFSRAISVYGHHNYGYGGDACIGAIIGAVHHSVTTDHEIYNCELHTNNCDAAGVANGTSDNNAASVWLYDGTTTASAATTVKFYNNYIHDDWRAFGHKHSGRAYSYLHHNFIENITDAAFHIRGTNNLIEYNVIKNATIVAYVDSQAQTTQAGVVRTLTYRHNTAYGCGQEFHYQPDSANAPGLADISTYRNNIFANASQTAIIFDLNDSTSHPAPFNVAGWSEVNNCYYVGSTSSFYRTNGTTKTRTEFDTAFGAGANIYSDPLFTNAAANDFTLQAGSPCIAINGERAGAL
jgi:hypothetical protein